MAKGLTAKQILGNSTPRQLQAAQYVRIKDAKLGHRKADGKPILRCRTFSTHTVDGYKKSPKPVYTSVLYGIDSEFDKLSKSRIKASCNCYAFTFWGGEWSLWRAGAADIIYGNGEAPDIRNPKYLKYACKHIIQVLRLAIKNKL